MPPPHAHHCNRRATYPLSGNISSPIESCAANDLMCGEKSRQTRLVQPSLPVEHRSLAMSVSITAPKSPSPLAVYTTHRLANHDNRISEKREPVGQQPSLPPLRRAKQQNANHDNRISEKRKPVGQQPSTPHFRFLLSSSLSFITHRSGNFFNACRRPNCMARHRLPTVVVPYLLFFRFEFSNIEESAKIPSPCHTST
jgi:hypothetical protein